MGNQMKNIRHILLLAFVSFQLMASGQQRPDSIQLADGATNKENTGDLRKEKDSLAKSLAPIPNKAIVYVIRNNYTEALIPYRIDCDSFQLAWVRPGTYAYTILDPGEHVFISTPPTAGEFRLKVNLDPGKIYYLELYYGIGIINTVVKMKMLDEKKGKKDLLTCKISKSNHYPQFPKSKDVEKFPPDDK